MPHSKKHTEYDKARAIWYAKLRKSGFEDIEQDDDNLKAWSCKIVGYQPGVVVNQKETYYYLATQYLNYHQFEVALERSVWMYHADGLYPREIADTLNKLKIKISKSKVWNIIKKHKTRMLTNYKRRKT